MKKVVDYLFESVHENGTYSCLTPSSDCKESLFSFFNGLNIKNLVDLNEYHCTLIYSGNECSEISEVDFNLPCKALPIGYKIFGKEKKVLVLELYCPNAVKLHNLFMSKYDAIHDYDEYIPHITIAEEYKGELPIDIPEIEITFNGFSIEEIRP